MGDVRFEAWSPLEEPATSLLDAAEAHLSELYGQPDSWPQRKLFAPPDGGYYVAWADRTAIAGGGFTRHDDRTAEIRRMYVVPAARGQGVARRLLAVIEEAVGAAGYARAILDTGPKQPHAEALYRSSGYRDIDNFRPGRSRASFWGEKDLT